MKLVIVESPTKAKTIQKYLGKDYKVLASGGHVCDLPEKNLGIDVDHEFAPTYVLVKEKKETVKKLKAAVKDSSETYLATDPDREGEAISWHLSNVLELGPFAQRIEFNEISNRAVNNAIKNPRQINMNLVNAQQARRVLDRLVGYKISPILNQKIKQGLSGGRVQSAALKMIVDREREIRAFVPEEFWNLYAMLTKNDKKSAFKATLSDKGGKKIKITNAAQAEETEKDLLAAAYCVSDVKRGESKSHAGPPFTTSTLQQDGSTRLGITAPEVMRLAQQLYEGVNIEGMGLTALVTYIRTDSVRVSAEAQKEAKDFITAKYGSDYVPAKYNIYSAKNNIQDAHEAIRPISLAISPEDIKDKVQRNLYRLYQLIYNRFLASQMSEAIYNTLTVKIKAECPDVTYGFKITGKTQMFKGFTVAYERDKEEDDESGAQKLPDFKEGEKLYLKEIKKEQKFTKAPSRYSDATLIKAMEENGIGRPATYANTLSVLAHREYTEKEGKLLKPTPLGETVTQFMEKNFSDIVDVQFTAQMENKLDDVVNGNRWQDVLVDFYPHFNESLQKAYTGEKKVRLEEEVTDVICEKCGANMVIRNGKYGKFLACPNYPACKNIKNIVEPVAECPSCHGAIVKKHTKTGKVFYGCANYPTCDFMCWELPAPIFCPKCRTTMRIVGKGEKKQYVCMNKNCEHVVIPDEK